jgi:hypothetical protein
MPDARWDDPREYDARDRSDEWPRVAQYVRMTVRVDKRRALCAIDAPVVAANNSSM